MKNTMPRSASRRSNGFTLIELLTVIAIIGIMAAILIPVVGAVRERAKVAKCQSNLRQLGLGIHLYASDHDDRTPVNFHPDKEGTPPNDMEGTYVADGRTFGQLVHADIGGRSGNDYVDAMEVLFCPSLSERVYAAGYLRPEDINKGNPIRQVGYIWMYRHDRGRLRWVPNDRVTNENQNAPYAFDFGYTGGAGAAILHLPSHESTINVLAIGGHIRQYSRDELNQVKGWDNIYRYLAGDLKL